MRSRAILLWALATIACAFGSLPDHAVHERVARVQLPPLDARVTQRRGSLEDPVTSLVIMYPLDGAIERPPVGITAVINVRQDGVDLFRELYGDMRMCMEVNNVSVGCSRLDVPLTTPRQWTLGPCTVQIYLSQVDAKGEAIGQRFWESTPTSFTLVNDADFARHVASFVHTKGSQHRPGYNLSLVDWAQRQQHERSAELLARLGRDSFKPFTTGQYEDEDDIVLVVGVKTAVASNFALRQAIRETWASKSSLPDGVKVVFVGCRPFYPDNGERGEDGEDAELRRLNDAIALEKLMYGDLLTDELDCNDAYTDLANKVKEFLHIAATQYSHAQYVMVADDDVYVRADKVLSRFKRLGPQTRYYSGQVPSLQHARKDRPTRQQDVRCFLSKEQYPLSELPPMAMGAYFFLSMDCVKYVSKNRRRLRDLGGMDDISVPLWMLAIQVHVQHYDGLGFLRLSACSDKFVAFGDLSPLAIREVHSNVVEQRPFCDGFERHLWFKSTSSKDDGNVSQMLPRLSESLQFDFDVENVDELGPLQVTTMISTPTQAASKVSYFPSNETLLAYSHRVCAEARLSFPGAVNVSSCGEMVVQLRAKLQGFYKHVQSSEAVELSRLALWKHNLFVDEQDALPMIVAYTTGASPSSIAFECLFASMGQRGPVLVIDETSLYRRYDGSPDVFVFSVLDGDCEYYIKPGCRQMVSDYLRRCFYSRGTINSSETRHPCSLMLLSGEAWELKGLDDKILAISTVANVLREKHVYLSMASMSFAERIDHNPNALLVSQRGERLERPTPARKFCAYMYANCARPNRELMYNLLNEMEPVDALGKCSGRVNASSVRNDRPARYNDEAVEIYKGYKFVVAFENSQAPGYVTEKLINPFLAGSVPIYWGNSSTVSQLFNPKSFIDCGVFPSLQECARYVVQVHMSPELYESYRREAPITNVQAFQEAFSWHPAVSSKFQSEAIAKYLWV